MHMLVTAFAVPVALCIRTRLPFVSLQCAVTNILQYILSAALLHSCLGRWKILRLLLNAPDTKEVRIPECI